MADTRMQVKGTSLWVKLKDLLDGTYAIAMSLTGSSAPLVAAAPTLVATIPFGSIVASGTNYFKYTGVLHRNARARTVTLYSTLNQPGSATSAFFPFDSTIYAGSILSGMNSANIGGQAVQNPGMVVGDGDTSTLFGANVDSFFLSVPWGATAPTAGNLYVYVTEEF